MFLKEVLQQFLKMYFSSIYYSEYELFTFLNTVLHEKLVIHTLLWKDLNKLLHKLLNTLLHEKKYFSNFCLSDTFIKK